MEPGQRPSPPRSCASRKDLKHIGASIHEHARLRFLKGDEAKRYNVLQKLAYLGVALVLLPLMLLTGLAMSPGMDAAFPILIDMFGGRQTARTIHFISVTGIVLFVVVHLVRSCSPASGTISAP